MLSIMKPLKLEKPARSGKTVPVNFRMTAEAKAAFAAKLKKDGVKAQAFFDLVLDAYLTGKISF